MTDVGLVEVKISSRKRQKPHVGLKKSYWIEGAFKLIIINHIVKLTLKPFKIHKTDRTEYSSSGV